MQNDDIIPKESSHTFDADPLNALDHQSLSVRLIELLKRIFITLSVGVISFLAFGALGAFLPQIAPQLFGLNPGDKHNGIETIFRLTCFFVVPLICSTIAWKKYRKENDQTFNPLNSTTTSEAIDSQNKNDKNEEVHAGPIPIINVDWDSKDPHEILGLSTSASAAEIRKAYYDLISLYHPDKMATLPLEFRKVADEKSKILNWAYNECSKRAAA